jgi:hypothetical protein
MTLHFIIFLAVYDCSLKRQFRLLLVRQIFGRMVDQKVCQKKAFASATAPNFDLKPVVNLKEEYKPFSRTFWVKYFFSMRNSLLTYIGSSGVDVETFDKKDTCIGDV